MERSVYRPSTGTWFLRNGAVRAGQQPGDFQHLAITMETV